MDVVSLLGSKSHLQVSYLLMYFVDTRPTEKQAIAPGSSKAVAVFPSNHYSVYLSPIPSRNVNGDFSLIRVSDI